MSNASPTPAPTRSTNLHEEHAALEARLHQLERQRSHSPEERYEILVIKKRKLALKDLLAQPE
jgi:uncharacterized protein YdcH (DUF465 family)